MIKNYLIVAFRNLWRNKLFSTINILGLAIGISAALVIYQIVLYDFSFDKFEKDGDRIYRVVSNMHFPDQVFKNSGICGPLPPEIRKQIPGIESSTYFWLKGEMKVKTPSVIEAERIFRKQSNIILADDEYFRFMDYQWFAGSAKTALKNPNEVVLAESRARTYFPNSSPAQMIGQVIVYDDSVQAKVVGIVKDLGQITDFTFKEFISIPTYLKSLQDRNGYREWGSITSSSQFLIKLRKNIDPLTVEKQILNIRKKFGKNEYLETVNNLQPLHDIHFNGSYDNFDQRIANKKVLFGLVAVGGFLLLLGCINFINLTTAQSARRAREIGIRKTMGSSMSQLVFQFLGETFLITLLATALSMLLMPYLFKIFSSFIPDSLHIGTISLWKLGGFVLLLSVVVSILAGLYPSVVLSRYQPALVLKNMGFSQSGKQSKKVWLRQVLTLSQFAIAQFFIMATLVVGKQIHYSINMDMGFSKKAIISFNIPFDFFHPDNKNIVLLEKLRQIPGIEKISLAGAAPASNGMSFTTMKFKKDGKEIETSVEIKDADPEYLNLFQLKLLAGRNLGQSDTVIEYVANEAYARFLGFQHPADIVGKSVDRGDKKQISIVGLVGDFHTTSTQSLIKPLVLTCERKFHANFHILLSPKGETTGHWNRTIASIEKNYKEIFPDRDFNYEFFDESIAKFYEAEQNTSALLNWCTGLSVFISCLGLLGLVIYTTTQRTREIGVRKVLGASVSQIVSLLTKDFLFLVILAFVIAAPLTWWAMHHWLLNYAYRTQISWWIFAATGLSMLVIAFFTLSIQTVRTAVDNPVKSLRTE
ncbi:MAG: FtsX-like permease family protein [Chitinophagales bacterium]